MTDSKHNSEFKYRNRRDKNICDKYSLLGTLYSAAISTVINDLLSENSKIKFLYNKIDRSKQIENKQKKILDAEFSLIDEENTKK
jgi:hypothetical protein